MPDNLNVQIGIDTSKVNADIAVLKAKLKEATAEMNKLGQEAAKTGDMSKVLVASQNVDRLTKSLIANQRVLRAQRAELAGVGVAATGAARGLHATAAASVELAEAGGKTSREVFTLSRDLGKLEISGVGVAKVFREFPKIAIPIAALTGAAAAVGKFANDGYKAITALDDLSKSSGFAKANILALRETFAKADVPFEVLKKIVDSMGESFDKAKVKGRDLGGAMSGVNVGRGPSSEDDISGHGYESIGRAGHGPGSRPTQSHTPGISDYQAPEARAVYPTSQVPGTVSQVPGTGSGFEGGGQVMVMRGGAPLAIDPSKGFPGLVDPKQFKNVEDWFAALRRLILNINEKMPELAREIMRGQGLDPVAGIRGFQGTTAEEFGKTREHVLSDPALQPGALPLARQFGAGKEEAAGAQERFMTEGGMSAMQAAVPALKAVQDGYEKLGEQIRKTREEADATMQAITKGVDSGELGAATEGYQAAWTGAFKAIADSWQSTVNYINTHQPALPGGGSQAGQLIPLAKAGGGMIPGSGTGDTVPAMLTPGEYVARRASVDYYGSGIFSALNNRAIPRGLFSRFGFAVGGLVGDRTHFADGGMVGTTSGGTPVHLHLDGQQFVMSAADHVASALVAVSQRYQMRSAGVKPSWYGGRPGG
jgi:hypothetical protein